MDLMEIRMNKAEFKRHFRVLITKALNELGFACDSAWATSRFIKENHWVLRKLCMIKSGSLHSFVAAWMKFCVEKLHVVTCIRDFLNEKLHVLMYELDAEARPKELMTPIENDGRFFDMEPLPGLAMAPHGLDRCLTHYHADINARVADFTRE